MTISNNVNPKRKALYDGLASRGAYKKSFEEFEKQFSTPEKIQKLHSRLRQDGLYSKELTDFENQFFSDKKKVDTTTPFTGLPESLPEDQLTKNIQASEKLNSSLPEQGFNEQSDKNKVLSELAEDAQAQENFRKLYETNPDAIEGFIKAAPDILKDLVRNRNKSPEQIREEFNIEQKKLQGIEDFVSGNEEKFQFEKDRWEDNALTKAASATGSFNRPIVQMASSVPKLAGIATNALERLTNMALGKEMPDIETNSFYKIGKWMDDKALEIGVTATDPRLDDSFLLNDIPSGLGSVASILATGGFGAAKGVATKATKFGVKEAIKKTGKAITRRPTLASGNMMGVAEFEQAIASGQSEGKSLINYFGGLGAGFTETIPLERALTRINKITGGKLVDIAKAGTVGALEEATQEGIQQFITNKVAQGTYDPERDLFQDVWRSMRAGGAIGLLLPGIGVAMRSMTPEQRTETKTVLNQILKDKAESEGVKVETPDGVLGKEENAQKLTPDEQTNPEGQSVSSQAEQQADNTGAAEQSPANVEQQKPNDSGTGKKAGEVVQLNPKFEGDPIKDFVLKLKSGMTMDSPEDLQFYENNKEEIEAQLKDEGAGTTPKVDQPIQQDAASTEGQGNKEAVQQNASDVRPGEKEAATPVLDTKAPKKSADQIKSERKAKAKEEFKALVAENAKKPSQVEDTDVAELKDPAEIAKRYYDEARDPKSVTSKELAISKVIGKVTEKSILETVGDKADFTPGMAKSYFDKKGQAIDQVAMAASDLLTDGQDGDTVTPQDVYEFIKKFKSGPKTIGTPSGNKKLFDLSQRYSELTGKGINVLTASKIVKEAVKNTYTEAKGSKIDAILQTYSDKKEPDASVNALDLLEKAPEFVKETYNLTNEEYETIREELRAKAAERAAEQQGQERAQETDQRPDGKLSGVRQDNGTKSSEEQLTDEGFPASWAIKAQLAENFDGRTQRQIETASKRLGKVALDRIVNNLKSKFPNFQVFTSAQEFKKAYDSYKKDGIIRQIIGEKGAKALDLNDIIEGRAELAVREENRAIAEQMYAQGKNDSEVYAATGWQRAKDGKMRYEIDYGQFSNVDALAKEILSLPNGDVKFIGKLKDIFKAKDLYIAHPELAEISVLLTADPTVQYDGSYDRTSNVITINAGKINRWLGSGDATIGRLKEKTSNLRGLRRVFSHELQHAVQNLEGFARGGNPGMFDVRQLAEPNFDTIKKSDPEDVKNYIDQVDGGKIKITDVPLRLRTIVYNYLGNKQLVDVLYDQSISPFEKYKRLYGETEAENAQFRVDASTDSRRETPINKSEKTNNDPLFLFQQGQNEQLPNGFVYRDRVYINPDLVRADTPIHEFGHIWNALAKVHNKALWRQGETLIKNSVYEKAVRSNPAYEGLSDEQIYDEALAMAIGEKGALMESKPAFVRFMRDLFAWIKQKLGIKSELDFANMTLDDYVNMVAKELLTPGEISFLSDVRLPETATFRLKNYKTPQDAYKAYQERELINQVAAQDKDQWKMTVDGLWRRRFNSFMEGIQDQTRRIKEIQNNIVDYHVKLTIANIKADPTLSPKEKSTKIDALKNKRPAVERALIPISQDPHSLLDIMTGKVQYKINQVRDKYLGKPTGDSGYGTILDYLTQDTAWNGKAKFDENSIGFKLKQEGLSLLDLGFYGYVRHAEARNTKVNERRAEQGLEPLEAPSGMTKAEIDAFTKQIDASGKKDVLEKYFQELRKDLVVKPLEMKLKEGIIDQETFDRLIDYYGDTYVPLNVEEAALSGNDAPIGRLNKGVFGSGIKGIKGTDSFGYQSRVNPFLQLIYNYEKTIADIERNKAIKAMAGLIKQYPDERIWSVKAPKYDIKLDDNGEVDYVKQFPDAEIDSFGVPYMEDGKRRYVVLKDDRLREIYTRTSSKRNEFVDLITSMTRGAFSYLRLAFTGLNPNFTFPNLIRDLQDAMVNLSEYSGIDKKARFWKGIRAQVVKGIGPSMKAVWQYERNGTATGEYGQAYQEMKESGGDIAWLDYNSAEQFYNDTKAEVDKFLTAQDTKGQRAANIGLMPVRAMLRYTLLANKSAEMGIRLSTYKTIREAGGSPEVAALAAKNVTVNFNKKGTWNPVLSSLYLFLNAGVQGSTRLLTSLARSKQSRMLVGAGILSSVALRYLLDAIDEDEEEKRSERLTKKDFAENAILPNPFDKDGVIKIPISYNMRPFKAIGDGFYDVYKGRQTTSEAAANVVTTFINGLVPIIESQGIPTLAQPFAEIAANKRLYNDTPISPAKDFNLRKKDSEKYFGTPTGLATYISEHLADVNSGRDDVLEISPNTIDYVFDWTLGGLKSWYKTGDNIAQTFSGANKFDVNKTFVVSRLYADLEKQDWRDQVNYYNLYEKSVRDEMSEENFISMIRFGKRALDKGLISKITFNRNKLNSLRIQKESYNNDYKQVVRDYLNSLKYSEAED